MQWKDNYQILYNRSSLWSFQVFGCTWISMTSFYFLWKWEEMLKFIQTKSLSNQKSVKIPHECCFLMSFIKASWEKGVKMYELGFINLWQLWQHCLQQRFVYQTLSFAHGVLKNGTHLLMHWHKFERNCLERCVVNKPRILLSSYFRICFFLLGVWFPWCLPQRSLRTSLCHFSCKLKL